VRDGAASPPFLPRPRNIYAHLDTTDLETALRALDED
jgi:hypothetical protein